MIETENVYYLNSEKKSKYITDIRFLLKKSYILLALPLIIYLLAAFYFRDEFGICIYHLIQLPILYLLLIVGYKLFISKFINVISKAPKISLTIKILCALSFLIYILVMLLKDVNPSGGTAVIESIFTFTGFLLGAEVSIKKFLGNPNTSTLLKSSHSPDIANLLSKENLFLLRKERLKYLGINLDQKYNSNDLISASKVINALEVFYNDINFDHFLKQLRVKGIIKPYRSLHSSKNSGKYYLNSIVAYLNTLNKL